MVNQVESSVFSQKSQNYKKTKIQNLIFPKIDICTVDELYFRTNSKVLFNYEHQILQLNQGGYVSFDTYFNGFSVETWKTYTNIKNVDVCLELQGSFKIQICNINLGEAKTVVLQKIIKNTHFDTITVLESFDISSYAGMIYIEIEALNNNCQIRGGCLYSYTEPENDIKLAVVICTYKREDYIYKNVSLLQKYLFSQGVWEEKIQLFIIDNGNTLERFDNSLIQVIPNKNAGGSGGFARGMIEVVENQNKFSHILLMDDDVLFDPEMFERLWNFISLINQKNICVGGSMLRLDKKYMQHERGGYWYKNKGCMPVKHNLDLRVIENILFNEIQEYSEYNAWWLYCFPVENIKKFGLPYPFFVRLDDVEFNKRIQNKMINLNGISVWHEQFENKHSPITEYYNIRNGLIFNSLYLDTKINPFIYIQWFLKPVIKHLFCYKYETAHYVVKATSDFLQGPNYLFSKNPEEHHKKLSGFTEKPTKDFKNIFINAKYIESITQTENKLHKIFRFLTLNGHLLPSLFFWNDDSVTDKGYKISPFWDGKPVNVFRARKVLYYNLQTKEGFVVQFSRIRFFQVLFYAIWLAVLMFLKLPKLKRLYLDTFPEFISQSFWEKYLEIEKSINNKNHV